MPKQVDFVCSKIDIARLRYSREYRLPICKTIPYDILIGLAVSTKRGVL